MLLIFGTSEAQPRKVYGINLQAQSLADALNGLSEQTGAPVVFPYDLVRSKRSNPVIGHYTLSEALDVLLRDTGLSGGLSDKGVLTISATIPGTANTGETTLNNNQNITKATNTQRDTRPAGIAAFFAAIAAAFSASADDLNTDSDSLAQVIVTAQKKTERLEDVPVAMTVLNPETLAENGQDRLQDYFASVPGLSMNSNAQAAGLQYVTIRGLSAGFYQNPTIATVVDDVPVGSSQILSLGSLTQPDLDPSDLARIEVLKGPQGTLYGADSLGGLIKYVTADPSTTAFSGRAEVTGIDIPGGGTGYGVRAAANIPLSDSLAIRLSGFSRRDPGYVDDLTNGQNNINSVDVYGGHLSLLYRPSEVISLKLSALVQDTNGNGSADINSNANYANQFPQGYLKQTDLPGTTPYTTEWQFYTATLNAKVAGIDIASVTGYNTNLVHTYIDLGGLSYFGQVANSINSNTDAIFVNDHYYTEKFTQEVRLSSSISHWLDWMFGGFFTHEASPGDRNYNQDVASNLSGGDQVVIANYAYPTTFKEHAAFGDLTFHVTQQFDVQLGGRQSWSEADYTPVYTGPGIYPFFQVQSPDVYPPARAIGNPFTYLVTPKYVISPNLQVYARIASGYRIGGPNLDAGTGVDKDVPLQYSPDKTTNYEVGIKGDTFDHMLSFDVATYYIDWKNFQLNVELASAFGVAGFTTNAGNAKSEGVEFSIDAHPTKGLTLGIQGSYDNAVLTQDLPPGAVAAGAYGLAGDRLPYNTRVSGGLTANQDFRLSKDWIAFFGGAVNYVGPRPTEFAGAPPPTLRVWMPSYTQLNLRMGARYESWLFNLYVNNVTDKRGIIGFNSFGANLGNTGGAQTMVIQPRTVALDISKTF